VFDGASEARGGAGPFLGDEATFQRREQEMQKRMVSCRHSIPTLASPESLYPRPCTPLRCYTFMITLLFGEAEEEGDKLGCMFALGRVQVRRDGSRMSLMQSKKLSQLSADNAQWEDRQLLRSGVVRSTELSTDIDDEDENRVLLLVHGTPD